MKIVNIDGGNFQMWLMIWFTMTLKATKNLGFARSLKDEFLEKPQRKVNLAPLPHSPAILLKVKNKNLIQVK